MHLPDCGLISCPPVPDSHCCAPSPELHVQSWSLAPLDLLSPTTSRHLPRTRMVPSCTRVHDSFGWPVSQVHTSTSVPFAVLPPGSSKHFALPPTCLIYPVRPLLAAAAIVQVNDVEPVPCSVSDAETVTL